jgi:hypothetical protein
MKDELSLVTMEWINSSQAFSTDLMWVRWAANSSCLPSSMSESEEAAS